MQLLKSLNNLCGDNRAEFYETYLAEMPKPHHSTDTFSELLWSLNDYIKYSKNNPSELKIDKISNDISTFSAGNICYFWYCVNDVPVFIVELEIRPQALIINCTGKSANFNGKEPYAAEVYKKILSSSKKNILMSDSILTSEGLGIWLKLLDSGAKIIAYNSESNIEVEIIKSREDLMKYYSPANGDVRFALSENSLVQLEAIMWFNTYNRRKMFGTL